MNAPKEFLGNAKILLKDRAQEEDGYYQKIRYVKMAGKSAYADVLHVLDLFLNKRDKEKKDFDWYKDQLHLVDEKLVNRFVAVYQTLFFSMGYDGNPSAVIAKIGLEEAELLINLLENHIFSLRSKIEMSREQLDSGKFFTHEEVKNSYKKWLE